MTKRVRFVFDERSYFSVEKLKSKGVEVMTVEQKKTHVFLRNCKSDEPSMHCGQLSNRSEVLDSIRNIIDVEVDVMVTEGHTLLDLQIEFADMTDAEIAELPS